jgi:hypothetical protein
VALPLPRPHAVPAPVPDGNLRRCTFRRVTLAAAAQTSRRTPLPTYGVECLYPDRERPLLLGPVERARGICEACPATGIFRADED